MTQPDRIAIARRVGPAGVRHVPVQRRDSGYISRKTPRQRSDFHPGFTSRTTQRAQVNFPQLPEHLRLGETLLYDGTRLAAFALRFVAAGIDVHEPLRHGL